MKYINKLYKKLKFYNYFIYGFQKTYKTLLFLFSYVGQVFKNNTKRMFFVFEDLGVISGSRASAPPESLPNLQKTKQTKKKSVRIIVDKK